MDARHRPPEMYLTRKEVEQVVQSLDVIDRALGEKKCIHTIAIMPESPVSCRSAGFSHYMGLDDLTNGLVAPIVKTVTEVFKLIPDLPTDPFKCGIVLGKLLADTIRDLERKCAAMLTTDAQNGEIPL